MSNPLDKFVKELEKYEEGLTPADPREEGCTRAEDGGQQACRQGRREGRREEVEEEQEASR